MQLPLSQCVDRPTGDISKNPCIFLGPEECPQTYPVLCTLFSLCVGAASSHLLLCPSWDIWHI